MAASIPISAELRNRKRARPTDRGNVVASISGPFSKPMSCQLGASDKEEIESYRRPMHALGPEENGTHAYLFHSLRKRSGLNSYGSSQYLATNVKCQYIGRSGRNSLGLRL